MSIHICPRCQQRFSVAWNVSDYVHSCNSGRPVLDQEDVRVIGDWSDYTGSATVGKHSAQAKSMNNKLQMSRVFIDDCEQLDDKSPRGADESSTRKRQHLEYIDLSGECSKSEC